jgi:LDH2 family malate/lactate/ureidoglycolate dehydrogenase
VNLASPVLVDFIHRLFTAAGLREDDARLCAATHVRQEMRGVITHGLRHVPLVLQGLAPGRMNPRPNRQVIREDAATVVIDGDNGPGILGCTVAMDRAIDKARQFGVGIGIVFRSNHFLAAAPYCLQAAEQDMVSICCSNTWASMGYPGTNVRAIANSPIGFGAPTAAGFPVIFDSALTTSAGKLAKWIREGQVIPPALMGVDAKGNPSDDPAAVLHGGAPWPIGDHKGAGLAVLVEILTGVLGGGGFLHGIKAPESRTSPDDGESQCCIAIEIARFMPAEGFHRRMTHFIADLKANPLAPGQKEILVPGEKAHRTYLQSVANGVPVEADVAADLREWAQKMKVGCPL